MIRAASSPMKAMRWKSLQPRGEPDAMETDMLDMANEVEPNSRLAYQIRITPGLDGLTVRLPARQV